MILKGTQRGNGRALALHLLNVEDNEHARVHEMRGFVSDNLVDAFQEAEAVSLGTKCRQYLFSMSLNPPPDAVVSVARFEAAIEEIEAKLGLRGQPRAVVFHEKLGRRHAHCVWSRIDSERMTAINLPHFKRRLQSIARDLYRTHGWEMPAGFDDPSKRDRNTFDRIEAAQAKSAARDPKALKALFRSCWERSDTKTAFAAALKEQGFILAKGTRRGFVAVSADGQVFSLSRWTGAGAKALRARLGSPNDLPDVSRVSDPDVSKPTRHLRKPDLDNLIREQRSERHAIAERQDARREEARRARRERLPRGARRIWAQVTGGLPRIEAKLEAEADAFEQACRAETDALIARHLKVRRDLAARQGFEDAFADLKAEALETRHARDPRQHLVLPEGDPLPSIFAAEFRPEAVLDHLSARRETFTLGEIDAVLRRMSTDMDWRARLRERLLASPDLVPRSSDGPARYTTRSFLDSERSLLHTAKTLAETRHFAVASAHVSRAVRTQNAAFAERGASVSSEQAQALKHLTEGRALACVVGYAGSGKSTLLSLARQAWQSGGYAVTGLALAGKAVDGLERSSGIASRTLASLETSWSNGYEPIERGSIVVIDEAGMVGMRQLSRVVGALADRQCKVVLVGDPDQLQPIEAGTPFRDIIARQSHATLAEIRRQRAPWQRDASVALAKGKIGDAVDDYAAQGCVRTHTTTDQAVDALASDYVADVESDAPGTTRLAMAHRRQDVFALNQAIRARLRSRDPLDRETLVSTDHGPRAFSIGDRVLFTENNRALGVRNGMLGTIEDVGETTLRISLDDSGRSVSVYTRSYTALDHGYAVSIHKSQGCTVDRSYVLSSKTMDRHLSYVAMTRHREEMRLYTEPGFQTQLRPPSVLIAPQRDRGPKRRL